MFRVIYLLVGLVVSSNALAHAGHDHSAPESGLIHLLWVAPLIIALVGAGMYLRKQFFNKDSQ